VAVVAGPPPELRHALRAGKAREGDRDVRCGRDPRHPELVPEIVELGSGHVVKTASMARALITPFNGMYKPIARGGLPASCGFSKQHLEMALTNVDRACGRRHHRAPTLGLGSAAIPALMMPSVPSGQAAAANGLNTLKQTPGTRFVSADAAAVLAQQSIRVDVPPCPLQLNSTLLGI
jgi:hypothetical protein